MRILLLGLGGCLGSIGRYLAAAPFRRLPVPAYAGTPAVNLIGCLAIGILSVIADRNDAVTPDARAVLFVGLLGGFTTFSAFGLETVELVQANRIGAATFNVAAHIVLGLGAVSLGRVLANA